VVLKQVDTDTEEEADMLKLFRFCDNIIQIRGHGYSHPTQRIYMEFAGHQDVHQLIKEYASHHSKRQIPEPFIWLVFLGLAEALYAMNTYSCTYENARGSRKHPDAEDFRRRPDSAEIAQNYNMQQDRLNQEKNQGSK
jgi:hypothetical protein